jgi:hypothetical protein
MPAIEKRAAEPEIVSLSHVDGRWRTDASLIFINAHGTQRLEIAGFWQIGIVLLALAMMISTVFLIVALLGVFVIWTPVVIVLAAGAFISSVVRSHTRRLR